MFISFLFCSILYIIRVECFSFLVCDDRRGGGGVRIYFVYFYFVRDVIGGRDFVEVFMWIIVVWVRSLIKVKKIY